MELNTETPQRTWREIEVTNVFLRNEASKKRIVVNRGGARSSKSWSIQQLFVYWFTSLHNQKFLITRKTMPSLRTSAYKEILEKVRDYGYYDHCRHMQSSPLTLEYLPNNNYMLFASIDDPVKIRSTDFNKIWMEEGNEFTYDDFAVLDMRLSAPIGDGGRNSLYISYNPTDIHGWINTRLPLRSDVEIIKSTYLDNIKHLPPEYIKALERYREEDPELWAIYGLGEYAEIKELIYKPFIVHDAYPAGFNDVIYGLDFGFNAETALVEIGIRDLEFYTTELLYETGLTNADLIERLGELIPKDKRLKPIYADCEDPNRITEIYRAGYNCKPCIKGKNSVKNGIDYVKRQRIHTLASNVNLNRERQGYKWKRDKNGNILDEPVKSGGSSAGVVKDHLCLVGNTLITTTEGLKPLKNITTSDYVLTRHGYRKVLASAMTDDCAPVVRAYFGNDQWAITGTEDHPVWIRGVGFLPLGGLKVGDMALSMGRPVMCRRVRRQQRGEPVYNLWVDGMHEYYANGILVSNCDALRYAIFTHMNPKHKVGVW